MQSNDPLAIYIFAVLGQLCTLNTKVIQWPDYLHRIKKAEKNNIMTARIKPAGSYSYVDDICIITCYFNSNKYRTKKKNFDKFTASIQRANLHHVIVECAFCEDGFEIPASENVVRVSSPTALWQKERLLNIALEHVPDQCSKIVWVDCDILFTNPDWAKETSLQLDAYPVVQPFTYAIRLPKNKTSFSNEGLTYNGFAYIYQLYPNALLEGNFNLHGHTGFAWAIRKDILKGINFYDACLSGVADHLMAHSFCGDWHSTCVRRMFLGNTKFYRHYERWSESIYARIRGKVGYCSGTVLHLWHGNHEDRRYLDNMQDLSKGGFDPEEDITLNQSGCWEAKDHKGGLAEWTRDFITNRNED